MDELLETIAGSCLNIETLDTRLSDRLDFHNVAVWEVKQALQLAYLAGKKAAANEGIAALKEVLK